MTRPLRLEHPDAIWHISSRGNERRDIYRSDRDRIFFLDTLEEVVSLRHWIVHAWVLMSNHYHLVIETPTPSLSRGMKRLNEVYADYFNSTHRRVGHLFQGRFKAILVEKDSHLMELLRYVVLNPVRAGMVDHAGEYRWSSYRATAGLTGAPAWLEIGWTLERFAAATRRETFERYRRFVADARGASYDPREHLVSQIYLGSATFCDRMQKLVNSKPRSSDISKTQRNIVVPSFDCLVEAVEEEFGETAEAIRKRSRRASRKAVAHLGWTECGLTLAAIGQWLGVGGRAVSWLVKSSEKLEQEEQSYREALQRIRDRIRQVDGGWTPF